MTGTRNTQIDLMRVIAAFAVVWLHVSANVVIYHPSIDSMSWWTGNVADALSRWCVPLFVMISGALLLPGAAGMSPQAFYRKRALRLLPPIVAWTVVYLAIRAWTEPGFTAGAAVSSVIKGRPYYHLWYLYMTLGLYIAAPFLSRITAMADIRLLIPLSLTIAAIESMLGGPATFLTSFIPYVGYFLAGHYLALRAPQPRRGLLALLALLCGGAIALGTGALLPTLGLKAPGLMYAYLNPLVIVMSLCVFLSLAGAPETALSRHEVVQSLSRISLGIYAIHPIWLWVLGRNGLHGLALHPAIAIPLTTLAAFVLSAISAAVPAQLPWLRRTVS